ncbi:glycosyltransferase [Sinomonas sp. B1-1]|uniref:glycosyltransferase n=1 Tax=Sinomonas sp. B1-1 TaxID=3141454 RepID=UPI003D2877AD
MSDKYRLSVHLLQNEAKGLREGRRHEEWFQAIDPAYKTKFLPSIQLKLGDRQIFVISLYTAWRCVRRTDSIVIGGWESPAYWLLLLAAKIMRRRCVGFYESTLESQRFKSGVIDACRNLFFRSMDAIVVPGPASKAAVLRAGVDENNIYEGFNSVDGQRIASKVAAARTRSPLQPETPHRYLFVGQLIKRKNVASLVRAMLTIKDGELHIVGDGADRQELESMTRHLGLAEKVFFHGQASQDELVNYYAQCHTLALVSTEEVWGLVANEALAAGMHLVVTDVCGCVPSIREMDGVFVTSLNQRSIDESLLRSALEYRGYIEKPKILAQGPESFAQIFSKAIEGSHHAPS